MSKKKKQPKVTKRRVFEPKCRAATFKDKREKRSRTRSAQNQKAIGESY